MLLKKAAHFEQLFLCRLVLFSAGKRNNHSFNLNLYNYDQILITSLHIVPAHCFLTLQ
jgi:hypothetical protein